MSAVLDAWYVSWRELKHFIRSRAGIAVLVIQPIFWLVLMGNTFNNPAITGMIGRAIQTQFGSGTVSSYLDYMTAGIVAMTLLFGGVFGGISIIWDKRLGFLNKMLAAPISRSSIALGKMLATALRSTFQAILILCIALIMGVKITTGPLGALLIILIGLLLCLAFSGISTVVGATAKTHETVFAVMNFLTMPVLMASSALFPITYMPEWLKTIASYNPLTYAIDPIRALMVSGWVWDIILPDMAVIGVFAAVMVIIATYIFGRSIA
jgi:ABC-2 type transport system permease protein